LPSPRAISMSWISPLRARCEEVDTGSSHKNVRYQELRACVLIPSERILL
jgi:hypothetical protein